MIDKLDVKVPYSASFQPEFRFLPKEVRYASFSSSIKPSRHYQGVVDLRPFGVDAVLHAYFKHRGPKNHKIEIFDTADKSLEQMGKIIVGVFDVEPAPLELLRLDLAADMYGIPLVHMHESLRVKLKRSAIAIGERDYEEIGKRRLEYFRYGRAPNCVRVYDKVAECKARMPEILKRVIQDADLPTFEDLFGFSENVTLTRVERQAGGGRIPEELATFGRLRNAAAFNPFANVEVIRGKIPFPDPARVGAARSLKLAGLRDYIERFGYQQARAMLNRDRNAKRIFDDLDAYLSEEKASTELSVDSVLDSYRRSVQMQIDGSVEKRNGFDSLSNPDSNKESWSILTP